MTRTQKQRRLDKMVGKYVAKYDDKYVTAHVVDGLVGRVYNESASFSIQLHRAWAFDNLKHLNNTLGLVLIPMSYDIFYIVNADPIVTIPILTE